MPPMPPIGILLKKKLAIYIQLWPLGGFKVEKYVN